MKSSTLSYRPASGEIVSSEEDAAASAFVAIESAKISIVRESVENCLRGYMRAREDDLLIYPHITAKGNNGLSLKGPKIYRDAVRPLLEKEESAMAVIKCANALGTLNGVLVTQRSLDFLRWDYPALFRVSFDFSPEQVKFNQPVTTRLRSVPLATRYDPAAGYSTSDVIDTDVNFNLNTHGAAQIAYSANDLSGTRRLLFPEQQEGIHHTMGLDICTALFALVTPANFPGQVADGSAGLPSSVAVPGKTVVEVDQMGRSAVIAVKSALNQRGATGGIRTILLTELYHDALEGDMVMIGNGNDDDPMGLKAYSRLPMVAQFQPLEAPYLPVAANLRGFAFRADALAIVCRPAADYSKVFREIQDGGGIMEMVTDPDTGLTVAMALFIDHKLGSAYMRIAYMFGVGVGNAVAGQLICSA